MILEIWAEAGRNPKIAAIGRTLDANIRRGLKALIEAAKARGEVDQSVEAEFAARVMMTFVAGLLKRHAHEPDFDLDTEAQMTLGVFSALFRGAIKQHPHFARSESR